MIDDNNITNNDINNDINKLIRKSSYDLSTVNDLTVETTVKNN
jgi:hypothetical protein